MRALLVIAATVAVLCRMRVIVQLAGCSVTVPGFALALAAEAGACVLLGWLVFRTARAWPRLGEYPSRRPS